MRHNKEDKRSKEIIQHLLMETEELRENLSQAQKAAKAQSKMCPQCRGESAESRRGRKATSLASLMTSMQSTGHEDVDSEVAEMLSGANAADAIKVSLFPERPTERFFSFAAEDSSACDSSIEWSGRTARLESDRPSCCRRRSRRR